MIFDETSVDRIPVTRADFKNWVEEFFVHMDNLHDWAGISHVPKEIYLVTVNRTREKAAEITENRFILGLSGLTRTISTFTCGTKELYAHLVKKLEQEAQNDHRRTQKMAPSCVAGSLGNRHCKREHKV